MVDVKGIEGRVNGEYGYAGFDGPMKARADIHALLAENAELKRQLAEARAESFSLSSALRDIGDYAHANSTGPAVPDALWEVRRLAYDAYTQEQQT